MDGRFSVKRAPQLSYVDRITSLSNDDMVYYLFQKNRFFRQVDLMGERRDENNFDEETRALQKKFKHIELCVKNDKRYFV